MGAFETNYIAVGSKSFMPDSQILDNYKQLGAAVVLQAVVDYEECLVESYIRNEKIRELKSKIYNNIGDENIKLLTQKLKNLREESYRAHSREEAHVLGRMIEETKNTLYKEKSSKVISSLSAKIGKYEASLLRIERNKQEIEDFFDDEERFYLFTTLDPDFVRESTTEKADKIIDILKEKGKSEWKNWKYNYGIDRKKHQ